MTDISAVIGCVLVVMASPNFEVCVEPGPPEVITRSGVMTDLSDPETEFWARVARDCAIWTKWQNVSPFWFENLPVQYHCTNRTAQYPPGQGIGQ